MSINLSTVPAIPDEEYDSGLDDLETNDLVLPKLKIDHDAGAFVDPDSGQQWQTLDVVVLGLVRNRILWPPTMGEEKSSPLCRSLEGKIGRPNFYVDKNDNRVELFPWGSTSFDKDEVEHDGDQALLNCADCPLHEWGSHPNGDNPWCSEQFLLPLLMELRPGVVAGALLSCERSAITPARKYLQTFKRAQEPTFVAQTTLSLDGPHKRGKVVYYKPTFKRGPLTEEASHPALAAKFRQIKAFLQAPRKTDDDEAGEVSNSRLDDDEPLPV